MFRALAVLVLAVSISVHALPTFLGKFESKSAAFLQLLKVSGDGPLDLVISSFTGNPFGKQTISSVSDIASHMSDISSAVPTVFEEKLSWPNTVTVVPYDAVPGFTSGVTAANGFLVPGFSVGAITLLQLDAGATTVEKSVQLSTDKGNKLIDGWFYHFSMWMDMNNDGRKDVVTARATKPIIGGHEAGEFLWLEQPATGALDGPWTEHVMATGPPTFCPDLFFEAKDLDGDGTVEFLFASFFSGGGFGVMWTNGTGADKWEAQYMNTVIIDTGLPLVNGFALQIIDLNGDGKEDVLFTNHVNNATTEGAVSQVVGFEIPPKGPAFKDPSQWTRHVLTEGFKIREAGGSTQAAPGFAQAFHPMSTVTSGKPLVVVEGDGDQRVYQLTPTSPDPSDWSYNRTQIYDCQGTVGSLAIGDVDGDSHTDVFVACYDKSEVIAFTY